MSTWETSKRYAVDYSVNLLGGEYYVIDSQGLLIAREGTAYEAVEAAAADAPATGAVIHIHTDCDGDGETVTITKSGLTLTSLTPGHVAGNTWQTPRFDKILYDATGGAVKNNLLYGLNLREVEYFANGNNCDENYIEKCQIRPTESVGQRGIRFTGGSGGYSYMCKFIDLTINDHMDQSGIDKGAISVENTSASNGQFYFIRLDYKPFDSDTVLFSADGGAIKVEFNSLNHVNLAQTGHVAFNLRSGGDVTDLKIHHSLLEEHIAMEVIQLDNGSADSQKFFCDFSHNTFSLTSGQTVTFIDNNAGNGDWIAGITHGVLGHMNLLKVNPSDLVIGTPNVGSRFMFNVSFIEEVTEDFVPVVRGGPLRWYSFSTAVDTIDQDPDYLHPDAVTAASATRADVQWLVPADGYVSNLSILLGTAPGVGDTWTFTFEEDGVNQTVTVPITGAAVTGSDTTNSFEVDKDDLLNIECAKTVAPAATTVKGTWAFQQKLP